MSLPTNMRGVTRITTWHRRDQSCVLTRTTPSGLGGTSATEDRLQGIVDRLKDPRPYFRDGGRAIMRDAASYNGRYVQDEMPRGGQGGGYESKQRSPGVTKRAISNKFTRPFAPILTDPAFAELGRGLALYAVTGVTSRPGATSGGESDGT